MKLSTNYSLNWAETITKRLTGKYARGWQFSQQVFNYTDKMLAVILARRPAEWEFIRAFIKEVDSLLETFLKIEETYRNYLTLVGALGGILVKFDQKYPLLLLSEKFLEPILEKGSLMAGRRPNASITSLITKFVYSTRWKE